MKNVKKQKQKKTTTVGRNMIIILDQEGTKNLEPWCVVCLIKFEETEKVA